jgi:hypothetical protein
MIPASTAEVYRCPGEEYDITRSVHLSRLAVSYAKCRHCPHAPGASAAIETMLIELPGSALSETPLFTSEGIRGRYLNDLNRATAAGIAGALASWLWDDFAHHENPMTGPLRAPPAATEAADPEHDSTSNPDAHLPTEGFRLIAPGRPGP